MNNTTIDLSHHNSRHTECCTCMKGYPKKCSCGGLIHAESTDSESFGLLVVYRCDSCNFVYDVQEEEY
ncbi:MAG: hypothetical protein N3I35_01905 [Clostridia bacterium]|nr:hypothetical protein [Clostridia bacterium]